MKTLQLETLSRETIKPSCPTPNNLRTYKLSLLDQVSPNTYICFVLFYSNESATSSGDNQDNNIAEKSRSLKKSLSETLSLYYPLAGRIKERVFIDCNDEGVEFFEARIKCKLPEILRCPDGENLNVFFPFSLQWKNSDMDAGFVLAVQVSYFDCGGMSIGVCISHKISDAATMTTFMNDWAITSRLSGDVATATPQFIAASVFPPTDQLTLPDVGIDKGINCVTRRYVFDATKIAELKAMAAGSVVKNPTKVQVVTALIIKAAISASKAHLGFLKPACHLQLVNIRKRMIPPLPSNSFGNIILLFPITMKKEREIEFCGLVGKLKEGITHFNKMEALKFRGDKWFPAIFESMKETITGILNPSSNINIYSTTSWCQFPLYQVDFGWEKPIWVGVPHSTCGKNNIILVDTRSGDGIEALVTLEEEEMVLFELDEDIRVFASPNPSALDA